MAVDENRLTARLTESDRLAWQKKLWQLLRLQTERYTMGQSTSVHENTARALLRSICFSLDQLHQAQPERDLLAQPPEALLRESAETVRRQTARAKLQYRRACRCLYQEESLSLASTLRDIGGFFRAYDPQFFAAEVPCGIDYQLARPVPEDLLGVAWLRAYLDRLLTEDAILRRFHPDAVRRVLTAVSPDHRELLLNLYEPVAAAALGVTLGEGNLFTLDITAEGQARLTGRLAALPLAEDRRRLLCRAGETLARRLELKGGETRCLLTSAADLVPRVEAVLAAGGGWQPIFPAFT